MLNIIIIASKKKYIHYSIIQFEKEITVGINVTSKTSKWYL